MSIPGLKYSILLSCLTLPITAQHNTTEKNLFESSVLTPVKSSTGGIEGPAVDKGGTVYYVNFEREGTIGQISPDGKLSVFIDLPEGSIGNGIRFDSKGNMLIADYTGHNILKVNMKSKKLTVFAHNPAMSQPNDIAIDSKDRLYASDPDWKNRKGRVWRIDKNGSFTLLDSLGPANGIEVSPDEKTLYVNAAGKVWAYDLSPRGDVSNKRLFTEFSDFGMDGMRCDVNGNLYITRYGAGKIAIVSPEGKLIREVTLTGKRPSNLAFGGRTGAPYM
jgi:gluconolactonase